MRPSAAFDIFSAAGCCLRQHPALQRTLDKTKARTASFPSIFSSSKQEAGFHDPARLFRIETGGAKD